MSKVCNVEKACKPHFLLSNGLYNWVTLKLKRIANSNLQHSASGKAVLIIGLRGPPVDRDEKNQSVQNGQQSFLHVLVTNLRNFV